jgi:Lrp/AsnC family leucine-responsive transcriptional regulator
MDAIDMRLLRMLSEDGRLTNAELARRVGMAPSAVFERVRRLEERGVLRGAVALLDPRPLGLGLLAFISVRANEAPGATSVAERLAALPEVQEVHHVAGEDCFLLKVRVADPPALARLLRERVGPLPGVLSTRTTIVMETLKETPALPVPEQPPGAGGTGGGEGGRR